MPNLVTLVVSERVQIDATIWFAIFPFCSCWQFYLHACLTLRLLHQPALKNSFKCNSHIRLEWYNVGDVRAVTGQRQRSSGSIQTQCNIRSGINVMSKLLSSYTTLYNKALWLAFPSHLVYFNQSEGFIVAKFIALVLEYSAGVQVYPKNNE